MTANNTQRTEVGENVRSIDVTVTVANLMDDVFKIYSQLFKDISRDEVILQELQGGYVNSIVKVTLKKDESKSLIFRTFDLKFNQEEIPKCFEALKQNAENQTNEENDGTTEACIKNQENGQIDAKLDQELPENISELIFSRLTEYKVMHEVSKHGLCKPVYARYNNGIAYGYTQGAIVNSSLMLTNDFLNEIAIKLAKLHSIKFENPEINFKTHFDRIMVQEGVAYQALLKQIDNELGDELNEYPFNEMPNVKVLIGEQEKILEMLTELGLGKVVFCHNDCNQKNIIWNDKKKTLGFIDFELAMNCYAVLEIGNLFGCYTGHLLQDFDKKFFPDLQYRRRFLRMYLEEFNKLNAIKLTDEEFESELQDLVIKTNLSALYFFVRQSLVGKFLDNGPEMFINEYLREKKKETKYFCSKWVLQIYKFYEELKDDFMTEAEERLKNKRKMAQSLI